MMSITPYSCPPYAASCLWINNVSLSSSSLSFSNFNFPPYAPTRSRRRNSIVLASADDEKQRRKTARGFETEPLETLELKFGHLLGENPQKTFAKVLGRNSNPDVSYLEIEKSMKGRHGLHLKRPLQSISTEGKERPLTNFSNGQSVSSNTKENRKSLSLIRPVMRREGKRVISPIEPTRLGSDAKAIHMESDSKEVTPEILLRKPSKQTHEFIGFAGQPTTPHLPFKKIEDSAKRSLEDTGLLRRPEAIRFDYNMRKRAGDTKAKEVVAEDSLGSTTDSSNTYAAAEKREVKRENRISLDRPTPPMNPVVLTSYEIDSQELNGSTEDEDHLQRSVSESKGDGSSFRSRKPKSIRRSVPPSIKSDKVSKADINIPSLLAPPRAKTEVQYTKEQLQDCKEATEIKAEEPSNGHEV